MRERGELLDETLRGLVAPGAEAAKLGFAVTVQVDKRGETLDAKAFLELLVALDVFLGNQGLVVGEIDQDHDQVL